jgi:hypothetical protein
MQFKLFLSRLLGLDKKALKIKSIRKTFNTLIMQELTTRMVVHDDRVYEVSDIEWIHGMTQVLLEEALTKKVLTGVKAITTNRPMVPDNTTTAAAKKNKVYH